MLGGARAAHCGCQILLLLGWFGGGRCARGCREIPDSVFLDQPMDGLPPLVDTTRRLELAAEQLSEGRSASSMIASDPVASGSMSTVPVPSRRSWTRKARWTPSSWISPWTACPRWWTRPGASSWPPSSSARAPDAGRGSCCSLRLSDPLAARMVRGWPVCSRLPWGEEYIDVELRASWTPRGEDLSVHLEAWADMVCTFAGPCRPPGCTARRCDPVPRAASSRRPGRASRRGPARARARVGASQLPGLR
jgi:hypothetical protein